MTIKAIYSSNEEIPEKYIDLYEEKDGAFRLIKIEGLKTDADVARVTVALDKEKKEHLESKKKFETFLGGKKPEEVQALLDRIPELEAAAAGKLDEEKINQVVEARLKTKIAPIERERDQMRALNAELEGKVGEFTAKEKQRKIHDTVRDAAVKMKVLDTAQEDVLMLAERMFEINEDGTITAKDGVGVTPGVAPEVWLTEMQQKRPHWWPASNGGGAKGSGAGGGFANNPWSGEHWSLTEQGKVVNTLGMEKATQMAKSVGVDINNPRRPIAKK